MNADVTPECAACLRIFGGTEPVLPYTWPKPSAEEVATLQAATHRIATDERVTHEEAAIKFCQQQFMQAEHS